MRNATLGVVLVAALACAQSATAADAAPALQLAACSGEGMSGFRCGTLQVPEDHAAAGGRRIALNVLVLPARAPRRGQPPLYSLAGGPGMAATEDVFFFASEGRAHWQDRDVVLVDQRGTGRSAPLRCPALEAHHALQPMYPLDEVRACRDVLAVDHDLTRYTTADSVRDLEAVRQALGHARIDLMGLSYGTRLAQAYARAYPQHVRAMALLGAVPRDRRLPLDHATNGQAVLDGIFDACAADAGCNAAFPDLRADWKTVLARLEQGPVQVPFERGGATKTVEIARGPFGEALRSMLLTTPGQRGLPYLIHRMAGGDFQPFLAPLLSSPPAAGLAEGLYLSLVCGEDTNRIEAGEIEAATAGTFLGRYRVDEQVAACREWPAAAATAMDAANPDPTTLEMPVLLLAGTMDYVTPLSWAREIAADYTGSRVVPIEHLGHFPIGLEGMACYDDTIAAFFRAGNAQGLDLSCFAKMVPPPFVLDAPAPATAPGS